MLHNANIAYGTQKLRWSTLILIATSESGIVINLKWRMTMSDQRVTQSPTIDGLKLTIDGRTIFAILDERIARHQSHVERSKREIARTPEDETEETPLLPDHMCENEAERHEWRIETLCFIRDHLNADATYMLGEADLEFAELLPEKPRWVKQEEYEERTGIAFNLERLTKRLAECVPALYRSFAADREEGNG